MDLKTNDSIPSGSSPSAKSASAKPKRTPLVFAPGASPRNASKGAKATQRTIKPSTTQEAFLEAHRPPTKSGSNSLRMTQPKLSFAASSTDSKASSPAVTAADPTPSGLPVPAPLASDLASAVPPPSASSTPSTQPSISASSSLKTVDSQTDSSRNMLRADGHHPYNATRFIRYSPSAPSTKQRPSFDWYCLVPLVIVDPVEQFGVHPLCPDAGCIEDRKNPCKKTAETWASYHPVHTLQRYFFALPRMYKCSKCDHKFNALNLTSFQQLPYDIRRTYDIHVVSQLLLVNFELLSFVDIRSSKRHQFASLANDILELRSRHYLSQLRCFLDAALRFYSAQQSRQSIFSSASSSLHPPAPPNVDMDFNQGYNLPLSVLTKTAVKNIYDSVENASRRDFYDRAMASLWGDAMEFDGTQKMTQRIREVQPNQTKQPSYAEVQSVLNEMGQIIYFHLSPDKTTESYLFIWDVLSRRARKRGFPCPRVICGDRGRVADLPILSEIVFPNPPTPYDKIEGAMFRSVDDIKRPSYVESKSANTNWDQVVKTAAGYRPSYRIDQPHVGRRITELGSKASILYTTFTKKTTDCFLDYDAVCIPDQPDSRVACIRAPADIKQRLHDLLRWNEHDTQKPKLVADITLRQQIECVFEEVDLGTVGDPVPFAMRRADGSTILWRNTQRLEATHNWANTEFGKSIRGSESADCYLASLIYRRNVKMGIKMKGDRDFGTCALWEIEAINAVGRNLFNTTLIPDLPDFPPTEEKFGSQVDFTHVKSSTAKITQSHVTIALQSATAVTIADAAAPTVLARVRDAMDLVVDPRTLGRNELPAEAHSSSASSVHANNAPSSYSDSETHSSSLSGPATSSSHGVVRATVPAVPVAPSSAATSSIPSAKRRRRPPPLLVADLPESTPVSKLFSTFENSLFLRLLAEAPHVSASVGKPQPNFKHIETQWAELVATQRFPMAPKSATQLQAYLRKLKQSINVKFIAAEMSRRAKRRDAPSPLPSARDICVLCCTEHPGPCTMFDDEHLKPAISRLFAGVQLAADCDLPTAVDILVPPNQPSVASSSSADPLPEADSSPQGGVAPEPTASSSADMPEEHEPSVQNRKRMRAWTQEEDSLLVELTNKHRAANNEIDWALVLSGWREKMEELCAVGTASSLFDRTKEAMKGRIKTRLNSPIDRQSSSGTKRQKLTAAPTQPTSHLSNSVSSASARGHDSSVISSSSSPHLLGPIGGGPAAPLPVYTSNPPVPLSRFPPSSSSSPLPTGTPFPNTDASAVDHLFNVAESARDPHEAEGAMYAAGVLLGKSSAAAEALSPFSATPSILSRPPSTLTHFPIPSSDNFAGKHAPPAPVLDSLFSSSSNPSVPSASTASSSPSASASTFALSSSSASQTFIAHPLAVPGPVPSSHAPNPTAVSKTTKGSKRKISDSKLAKKRDRRSTFKWTKGFENTVQQCYDVVTEDKPPGFFATKFWKGVVDDLERKQTVAPQSFELVEKFRKVANGIKNIAKSVAVTDYHQAAQIVSKKLQEKKDKSPGDQSVWMIPSVAHIETILGGKTRNGK